MLPTIANYQTFIRTKWIGQTNHKPSRVKATSLNTGKSVIVSWNHDFDAVTNHLAAATKLYERLAREQQESGIELTKVPKRVYMSSVPDGYVFTSADS